MRTALFTAALAAGCTTIEWVAAGSGERPRPEDRGDGTHDPAAVGDDDTGAAASADTGSAPADDTDPTDGPADCSPGPGSGEREECAKGTSWFFTDVRDGVLDSIDRHPEYFLEDDVSHQVVDVDGYIQSVVDYVNAQGHCAIRDPNDWEHELAVKHDNAFAESFNIHASTGYVRWGDGIYTATCTPAWF